LVSLTWPFWRMVAEAWETKARPRTANLDNDSMV
jgi:hypothetical protein